MVARLSAAGKDYTNDERQILMKTLTGKTITINAGDHDTIYDLKVEAQAKDNTLAEHNIHQLNGKTLPNDLSIAKAGVQSGCTSTTTARPWGGAMSQDDIKQALFNMEARMQQLQAALLNEQSKTEDLENKIR